MRICIDGRPATWYRGTGIGNYTYLLIHSLAEIDWENEYTIIWPSDDRKELPERWRESCVTIPEKDPQAVVDWLNQKRPDIYHVPQNGFHMPLDTDMKKVVTIHDIIPFLMPSTVRHSYLKRFLRQIPAIARSADHIITVSGSAKKTIIDILGIPEQKISVIYSAPEEIYKPLDRSESTRIVRERYGIEEPFILYAGGLNPRKNVKELIYAFSKICRELYPIHRLVILGDVKRSGERLGALAELLDISEYIIFPGFVETSMLPILYNASSLFVYPSLYEGFGLPPIEAMKCGTPVIVSDTSSLPEIVGEAALKVDPRDTLALAEAIKTVAEDEALRQHLSAAGLKWAERYSWDISGRAIIELYKRIS